MINHAFPLPLNKKDKEGELESVKRIVLADESIVVPLFLKRKGKQEVLWCDYPSGIYVRKSRDFFTPNGPLIISHKHYLTRVTIASPLLAIP